MLLKRGSRGEQVRQLQLALGLDSDGIFGGDTEAAVKAFQQQNDLGADGIVGKQTLAALPDRSTQEIEEGATTDNAENVFTTHNDLVIHKYFLPKGEYKDGPTDKEFLFLHHTAGWHDPYRVIDGWGRDDRGAVATEFVMGGQSVRGNDNRYDGELVQCIPEGAYGWHLGTNGSQHMHTHSVGIELCNFGYAEDGKTYAGQTIDPSLIATLPEPFRGHEQWHVYSAQQIETLRKLILWIAERDSIDVRAGLVAQIGAVGPQQAFDFNQDAYDGTTKGMWTHTNTRRDKTDLSPQEDLVDMLVGL
jgi:hypothetical protein